MHSWIEDEPGFRDVARQAARLFSRGLARPLTVFGIASVLTASVVGVVHLGRHTFSPRYVMRVVEAARDPTNSPRPRRQLAEYVRQAVFTSGALLDLIRRYGLYPRLSAKDPSAAVDSFREDIAVEVYKNYFVEERSAEEPPRSARLSVSYRSSDPDMATAVTRELGQLVVRHEGESRRRQASRAAEAARREVEHARQLLATRRAEAALKRDEVFQGATMNPMDRVELASLLASAEGLERREAEAEKREAELVVGAALEGRGLGMSFDVVDDASLPSRSRARDTELLLAGASLVFGMPLVVAAVGAFSSRKAEA